MSALSALYGQLQQQQQPQPQQQQQQLQHSQFALASAPQPQAASSPLPLPPTAASSVFSSSPPSSIPAAYAQQQQQRSFQAVNGPSANSSSSLPSLSSLASSLSPLPSHASSSSSSSPSSLPSGTAGPGLSLYSPFRPSAFLMPSVPLKLQQKKAERRVDHVVKRRFHNSCHVCKCGASPGIDHVRCRCGIMYWSARSSSLAPSLQSRPVCSRSSPALSSVCCSGRPRCSKRLGVEWSAFAGALLRGDSCAHCKSQQEGGAVCPNSKSAHSRATASHHSSAAVRLFGQSLTASPSSAVHCRSQLQAEEEEGL